MDINPLCGKQIYSKSQRELLGLQNAKKCLQSHLMLQVCSRLQYVKDIMVRNSRYILEILLDNGAMGMDLLIRNGDNVHVVSTTLCSRVDSRFVIYNTTFASDLLNKVRLTGPYLSIYQPILLSSSFRQYKQLNNELYCWLKAGSRNAAACWLVFTLPKNQPQQLVCWANQTGSLKCQGPLMTSTAHSFCILRTSLKTKHKDLLFQR